MTGVGFVVRGVAQTTLDEARQREAIRVAAHEKEREAAQKAGEKIPPRIRGRTIKVQSLHHRIVFGPTIIESSAKDAAALAEKSGFLDVQISRAKA